MTCPVIWLRLYRRSKLTLPNMSVKVRSRSFTHQKVNRHHRIALWIASCASACLTQRHLYCLIAKSQSFPPIVVGLTLYPTVMPQQMAFRRPGKAVSYLTIAGFSAVVSLIRVYAVSQKLCLSRSGQKMKSWNCAFMNLKWSYVVHVKTPSSNNKSQR